MLNRNKTGLSIFDEFSIDRNLPKNKKIEDTTREAGVFQFGPNDLNDITTPMGTMPDWLRGSVIGNGGFEHDGPVNNERQGFKNFIIGLLKKYLSLAGIKIWTKKPVKPKFTVQDFFRQVKGKLENIQLYSDKVNEFLRVANHAKQLGQTALFEEIMKDIELIKLEAILFASNFKTCITEEQIVQFYKESEKGLSLHFIKNFGRVIPLEVCKIKTSVDELMVFDNYVVLYYDKDQKTFKETQEEIDRRKDPILFGLIRGQRKLYYVAEWIDEYCDLTLKQLVDKFGEEAISANDITVKYNKD